MPTPSEPPDIAVGRILTCFTTAQSTTDEACRDLARVFGGSDGDVLSHLRVLLDDVRAHRITAEEARRDLVRAAIAAQRGDRYFLALLAPVHA